MLIEEAMDSYFCMVTTLQSEMGEERYRSFLELLDEANKILFQMKS